MPLHPDNLGAVGRHDNIGNTVGPVFDVKGYLSGTARSQAPSGVKRNTGDDIGIDAVYNIRGLNLRRRQILIAYDADSQSRDNLLIRYPFVGGTSPGRKAQIAFSRKIARGRFFWMTFGSIETSAPPLNWLYRAASVAVMA